jgi:class 3 adenylate cyclase
VRQKIRATLDELKASVGFASAAAGGDLLFLEEMRRRDAQVHVVLPWAREAFVTTSVARAGTHWVERFDRVLAEAASVRMLGELNQPTDRVGYQYANSVMTGLARLTARALGLDLVPLALWDERPGSPGGTADFVASWQSQGLVPTIISLPPVAAGAPVAPTARSAAASTKPAHEQQVRAMLFADIVGYSRLPEAVIPAFVREFMGGVSRVIAESAHGPISVNTWGDALYFVFDRVESAGCFALELVEMIEQTAWVERGVFWEDVGDGGIVARPLRLRTALHAGPVFWHFDPVLRQLSFTGAHVSRAARIEPVAAPGEVFASEEFAALAAAESATGFACHFVGTMPLAKKYPGVFRIYRLRRVQSFPLDQLGRLIHEAYCRERAAVGDTPAKNAALRSWDDLPADLQTANREQAADIPAKLRALGYELVTAPRGLTIAGAVPPDDPDFLAALRDHEERLSIGEHERWSQSRVRAGWVPGPRNDKARHHPNLAPWDQLDEAAKDKDREAVRSIPLLLERAGFTVRRR